MRHSNDIARIIRDTAAEIFGEPVRLLMGAPADNLVVALGLSALA
jgi:hypothetical protein